MTGRRHAVLVYLYGPPAVGKLTVAEKVRDLTGYRLFHNHLTVNAVREVFEFGSASFLEVVHRIRIDVFATAMTVGTNLIFTNNSAWGGRDDRGRFEAFAAEATEVVEAAGGTQFFVQLTAPLAVLESRVQSEWRRSHGKLVDVERLRQLVLELDDSPLHANDLRIDTSELSVDEAARRVVDALPMTSRDEVRRLAGPN